MRFFFLLFSFFLFSFGYSESKLQEHIKYHVDQPNRVGLITIDDRANGINQSTWLYVKKALDYYKEKPPIFIILELNTPGGEVFSAQSISDALKEMEIQYDIPVVAYINNWAISAGAMLAYSSRFIAVAPDASMGAAAPVIQDSTGKLEEASEKVNSAIRSDMANRARLFGRNPWIAEAMVDKDIILVERSLEIIKLNAENEILSTDKIISGKGKLLTLDSQQLMAYQVANFLVPAIKKEMITEKELTDGIWSAKKSAIFHTSFFEDIPSAFIDQYKPDWKTSFFMFLTNPMVASFLFMAMLLGFYTEFNMPGATWPLFVGISALSLIILSSFNQEIGSYLELILLFLGALLLAIELFVMPTFGFLGIIGVLLFLGGLFGLMLPGLHQVDFNFDTNSLNAAGHIVLERFSLLSAAFLLSLLIMALLSRFFFKSIPYMDKFVLKGNEQTGYSAVGMSGELPPIGAEGTAFSSLRPSGKVLFNKNIYDALTKGGFIEKDTAIILVSFEGSVLNVKEKEKA